MIDYVQLATFRQSLPESQRYEVHRFFVVRWDVVAARFLIQQTGKQIDRVPVLGAAKACEFDKHQTMDSWAYVDPKRAMSDAIDPDIPVILALIAREEEGARPIPLLIDGLHRLYKACREERIDIPCYALTPDEEQVCRIERQVST